MQHFSLVGRGQGTAPIDSALDPEMLRRTTNPSQAELFLARDIGTLDTVHSQRLSQQTLVSDVPRDRCLELLVSRNPADRMQGLRGLNPARDHEAAVDIALLLRSPRVTIPELQQIASIRPVPDVIIQAAISCLDSDSRGMTPARYRIAIQRMRTVGELVSAAESLTDEQKGIVSDFSLRSQVRETLRQPFAVFQKERPYSYARKAIALLDSNSAEVRAMGVRALDAAPTAVQSTHYEQFATILARTVGMLGSNPAVACERLQDAAVVFRRLVETPTTQAMAISFLVHALQPHEVLRINLMKESQAITASIRSLVPVATFFTTPALESPVLNAAPMGRAGRDALVEAQHRFRDTPLGDRLKAFLTSD